MTDAPTSLFDVLPAPKPQPRRRNSFRDARRNTARQRPRSTPEPPQRPRRQWPLGIGINVVLFAGMGGACQGLEKAGFPVAVAVNHDEVAIAAHRALNRHTRHIQADILEVDPLMAVGGQHVFQLWASPDCVDFSVAKGGAPRSPRRRSLPWQICRWAGRLRKRGLGPDIIYLENVREIRGWGPLIAKRCKTTGRVIKIDGSVAAKGEVVPVHHQMLVRDPGRWVAKRCRKTGRVIKRDGTVAAIGEVVPPHLQAKVRDTKCVGRTWRAWVKHIRGLGAQYEDRDLCCANYGVATTRNRLFGIGHFSDTTPVWPQQTHAHRKKPSVLDGTFLPHVSAASILDWSIEIPSIFDRKKALVTATERRLAVGTKRYVLDAEKPFLVHLTHHGDRAPLDTEDAAPTFTGAHRGELALAVPSLVSTTHRGSPDSDVRVHDGADGTPVLTANVKGGELAVAAAYLTKFSQNSTGQAPDDAIDTLMPGAARFGVATADLVPGIIGAGGRAAQVPPMDGGDALNTSTAKEDRAVFAAYLAEHRGASVGAEAAAAIGAQTAVEHHAVAGAWLVQNNSGVVGHAADEPLSTTTAKEGPQAVSAAYLVHQRGTGVPTSVEDGMRAMATGGNRGGDHVHVAAAHLTIFRGNSVGADVVDSAPTITANGHNEKRPGCAIPLGVAAASMIQVGYGEAEGQAPRVLDVEDGLGTQVTQGGKHAVTAAYLTEYYGTGGQHQDAGAALNTVPSVDRFTVNGVSMEPPPLTPAQYARARQVAEFLRKYDCWDGGDIVTVGNYILVDIGMRMLKHWEAAAAHGLTMPDAITIQKRDRKGNRMFDAAGAPIMISRPLTKTEAMRLIGNSVPSDMALLLSELNAAAAMGSLFGDQRQASA